LWAKGFNIKDIHKEIFSVYGKKYLSCKAVHNLVEKFSQGRSKVVDDARQGAEVVQIIIKRILCCGFRRAGKEMGQVYQCWWRICREINVFFLGQISHASGFTSVTSLLTLPLMYMDIPNCNTSFP
jgi:hypothetical protein